jgi:hypothetical protein
VRGGQNCYAVRLGGVYGDDETSDTVRPASKAKRNPAYAGRLFDYKTGADCGPATAAQVRASKAAAKRDGGAGVIVVNMRSVFAEASPSKAREVYPLAKPAKRNPAAATFKTEDGYTFFLLPDGRVADSLDENAIDQSWPNLRDFRDSMKADGIAVKTVAPAKPARPPVSPGEAALKRALAAERRKTTGFDAKIAAWNEANKDVKTPFELEMEARNKKNPRKAKRNPAAEGEIKALWREAHKAGDDAQVAICFRALGGTKREIRALIPFRRDADKGANMTPAAARRECARVIESGRG